MKTKLYALLLEDIKKDAELLHEILSDDGFELEMDVVETESDYLANLKSHAYDIIFADYTLPGFNGQAALEIAKKICPNIPFICISGTIGEDTAVELLKQGATDYVLKDRMERLVFATKRALDAAVQLNKFKLTEIELQTNRRLLQTIINNALDAIFIKDIDGKYILFNEAAEKAIGKTAKEVLGKDVNFLLPPKEAKLTIEIDKKVMEDCAPVTYEESLTLADGTMHIFHTIKCPMFDDKGKPKGLFGISRDITERKQMENHLTQAKDKAEESDRLKTAFLHNISHEIRTPMNAIVGFSAFLNDPDLETEKRKRFIDIITQSIDQLLSIISDIIRIATIEAGQEKIVEKEFDLQTTCEQIHEQFMLDAKSQHVLFSLAPSLTDNINRIITDETKLIQVLTNLIGNALKFTKKGYVNFGYSFKETEIEFFVEDTGIGIPPEMHDEIFKRFSQVENTTVRSYGGSGLGLSISKAYIELLGGKIWLHSEIEKGTTFYFTIPFKKVTRDILQEWKIPNDLQYDIKQTMTILIAEDEESNFLLLKELLSGLPLQIVWAQNGMEALEICKSKTQIDLVLMDIKMPIMDGYEATKQIREFKPVLPIIAQTAYTTDADRNHALACGCNDFISKPIKKELLYNILSKNLNKSH